MKRQRLFIFLAGALMIFCNCSLSYAFTLPATGQTTCYDIHGNVIACAGTGQDGANIINPMSYTDNGNGTVTDNNTGLMWQQQDDGTIRGWSDAGTYCTNLSVGGHSDWRLPAVMELMSIVNYGRVSPAINTTYFPNTSSEVSYWSSTISAEYPRTFAWYVRFSDGPVYYTLGGLYVRCVRGGQEAASFSDNGNGTVSDSATGLMWQQGEPGFMQWTNALSYCNGLNLGGNSDWRLPNIKELSSIVDYTQYNPAINTTFFPNVNASGYWSSTTYAGSPYTYNAWYVGFNLGSVVTTDGYKPDGNQYVRCVRGGQSGSSGKSALLSLLNPYACSIYPADCITLPGTNSIIGGLPALGISADGQSAALIAFRSTDKTDSVQINLSATGFSGVLGSLAQYDPNFLNESSAAASGNTSLMVQSPTFCDNDGNCTFLALLWAPNTMSGNLDPQPVPLTITATQGTSTTTQASILLQPPPLVLVHGIWSSAAAAWPPFEQWLASNYPSKLIVPADYGRYSYLAFYDPHIQNVLANAISHALASAAKQSVVARKVDVVAHSMGGLATRYFLEKGPPSPIPYLPSNPVHKLITIGTPHLGSPLAYTLLEHQGEVIPGVGGNPTVAKLCSYESTCTLGGLFALMNKPLGTGVLSLVAPQNEVRGGVYNSIEGQAPEISCTGILLDLLLTAFVPGDTDDGILGSGNDTIVGGSSQVAGAAANATINGIVHTSLCGDFDTGETSSQAVWTQAQYWLMGGSGAAPTLEMARMGIGGNVMRNEAAGAPAPVLDLTGYTQVSAAGVSLSPVSGSTLTINSATSITATSLTKTITEVLLFQMASDPTDIPLLYSTQSPFTIAFTPTRIGSTTFVAFVVFSDNTFATTELNYTFQPSGSPQTINLVNALLACMPVGSSAIVDVQALFSNGYVDVSQAATYTVQSGTASVISVDSTGEVTANGQGVDQLDVAYDGVTASAQISVCSAANAVCGSSNGANLTAAPTTNLCSTGTPSAVVGNGPWIWTCLGTNGESIPTCTAYLEANQLLILLTGTGSGTVTSSPSGISCGSTCSAPFSSGTSVTLLATANSGSTFTGWSGACSSQSASATCVLTMPMSSAEAITANYDITGTTPFSDVATSEPYASYIEAIYNNGITTGCGSGDYCPSENVTRDQMATFLVRATQVATGQSPVIFTCNGGANCATETPYFNDVPATDQFFPYVQKLFEFGITTGCGNSDYCPSEDVTRDQMAAFLVRATQVAAGLGPESYTCNGGVVGASVNCSTTTPYFNDAPATDPFFPYVQKLKELGITTGCGNGYYCPSEDVTRDQMAAFLSRAFLGMH